METITLEFSKLEILVKKERWRLYFIVVAEHPTDNDKMVVSTFPEPYIRLKPNKENQINFEPEGSPGADGLFVVERDLPTDKRIKVDVYLRHCRETTRNLGKALADMKTSLGSDAFGIVTDIMGKSQPWLVVAKKAVPMIGTALSQIKDRDMGFVSMHESFGEEFEPGQKLERANSFSTGDAKIWWKWKIQSK